jgi:hypothetical protein
LPSLVRSSGEGIDMSQQGNGARKASVKTASGTIAYAEQGTA